MKIPKRESKKGREGLLSKKNNSIVERGIYEAEAPTWIGERGKDFPGLVKRNKRAEPVISYMIDSAVNFFDFFAFEFLVV